MIIRNKNINYPNKKDCTDNSNKYIINIIIFNSIIFHYSYVYNNDRNYLFF